MTILEALRVTTESIKTWTNSKFLKKDEAMPKLTSVTMLSSNWNEEDDFWSQIVECNGINMNSKLDLQPTPAQLVELQDSEISLMATNNNGVVTIYAIGDKPTSDMAMQILITEVSVV